VTIRILLMTTNDWNGQFRLRHHSIFGELSKRHEIHVVRLALSPKSKLATSAAENIIIHEPLCLRSSNLLSYYLSNYMFHFSKSLQVIKRESIDVIVVSNLISGLATISAAKLAGVPIVFDLLDFFPSFVSQAGPMPKLMADFGESVASRLLEANLSLSDAIIVTSTVLRDLFKDRYSSKIHYVPNGVDTSRFEPSAVPFQFEESTSLDNAVVGFVGHFDFWVDADLMIEAAEILAHKLDRFRFLIVGGGFYLDKFRSMVRKHHLEQYFVLPGIVPYEQVPSYVSAMDVCFLPFRKSLVSDGACPNKLFEYLACGKPVISTNIAEVARIAPDIPLFAEGGREFAELAIEVMSSDSYRKTLCEKGRSFAMKYDWAEVASAYERVLEQVAKK
jgi:phosphatidylinositol alpha-1,6-mannosyltransferase